jgi:hypothetical protein
MKHLKIIILTLTIVSIVSVNRSYSQTNDENFIKNLTERFEVQNINKQSLIILLTIYPDIKTGNYEAAAIKLKQFLLLNDNTGKLNEINSIATEITNELKLLNQSITNSNVNETVNILTKIFPEQKSNEEKINSNIDTTNITQLSARDTLDLKKYKLSILIDKIKIYDYCDGRQDFNYAGEFTSEVRIISNGQIIKLYQQNNLLEKKGDEDIILNESLIPMDINSSSNIYKEVKIEAYLYEWDGDEATKLYNYVSLPINQWNNKFNENFQKYHLFLDKNNECKAGLYYQIKLDKIN